MAYERIYERVNFKDLPDETTPIDAVNLAKVETGIEALDTRIVELDANKADSSIYASGYVSLGRKSGTEIGDASAAIGDTCTASGRTSFSTGSLCVSSGNCAFSSGASCKATGHLSHAEGSSCIASGHFSHAEGMGTIAGGECQHAQGKYNIEDTENKYACIVGAGRTIKIRKNIYTLDWQGNAVFAGDVTDGKGVSLTSLKTALDALAATVATLTGTQQ